MREKPVAAWTMGCFLMKNDLTSLPESALQRSGYRLHVAEWPGDQSAGCLGLRLGASLRLDLGLRHLGLGILHHLRSLGV